MTFKVKIDGRDDFSRPVVIVQVNKSIVRLVDVDCGDNKCTTNGLPGRWHTVSSDGEPIAPIKPEIILELE